MVIFLIILLIAAIISIMLLNSRITIGSTVIMDNLACSVFFTLYLFGKIPVKKITLYPKQTKRNKEKAKKVRRKRDINQLKQAVYVIKKLFFKSFLLSDFKLYVKIGTGDAGLTAVVYGLLWTVAGFIPEFVFTRFKVKNKEIKIETDFKEKVWKVNFNCIFSLKIVNIIDMVIELFKHYLKNRKGGDAGVRSSDRRTNDYSNAKY